MSSTQQAQNTGQDGKEEHVVLPFSGAVKHYVIEAFKRSETDGVTDFEIVRSLLIGITDYARGRRPPEIYDKSKDPTDARRMPVEEWLQQVTGLYDLDKVAHNVQEIHGRMVIIGLTLLDSSLAQRLTPALVQTLADEIRKKHSISIEELLSPEGQARWRTLWSLLEENSSGHARSDQTPDGMATQQELTSEDESIKGVGKTTFVDLTGRSVGGSRVQATVTVQPRDPQSIADTVDFHPDNAATIDKLGRIEIAKFLARQIRLIRRRDGASVFRILLHGPWGSGKTSILNFMGDELSQETKSEPPWVVVYFNAWQYQRLRPPWWSLMNRIYQEAALQLEETRGRAGIKDRLRSSWLRLTEQAWRFKNGRAPYVLAGTFIAALLSLAFWSGFLDQTTLDTNAKTIGGILSTLTALWGIIFSFTRSVLLGSPSAAQSFVDSTRDPMKTVEDHFCDLVRRIDRPLAVFIDDLDRCQSSYAVELLEGIQTLFLSAPVTYVIAADRQWLETCFEEVYKNFKTAISQPSQSLGDLFLAKTFQLSTWVPPIPPKQLEEYMQHLTWSEQEQVKTDPQEIRQEFQDRHTAEDVGRLAIERARSAPTPSVRQAYIAEGLRRLASPEIEKHTEHILISFHSLLEPNPRSMKRLVNSFGMLQAIQIIAGVHLPSEKLAQLIILISRWPRLAEHLLAHPNLLSSLKGESLPLQMPEDMDKSLWTFLQDDTVFGSVRDVVNGTRLIRNGDGTRTTLNEEQRQSPLTEEDVVKFAQLYGPVTRAVPPNDQVAS